MRPFGMRALSRGLSFAGAIVGGCWLGLPACHDPASELTEQGRSALSPPSPSTLDLVLEISGRGVRQLLAKPATRARAPRPSEGTLGWILTRADGSVAAEGTIGDPRRIHAEFDAEGRAAPIERALEVGFTTLRLPAEAGTLTVRDRAIDPPRVLGQIRLPAAAAPTPKLAGESDVLGEPIAIRDSGEHAVRVLLLPDGYREDEMEKFHADAASLMNGILGHAGYAEWKHRFSFFRQDVRSHDSGLDQLDRCIDVETAFDSRRSRCQIDGDSCFPLDADCPVDPSTASPSVQRACSCSISRCVFPSTEGYAAAVALGAKIEADVITIVINDSVYGGCASAPVMAVTMGPYGADVIAHEMGHALLRLADEYDYGTGTCSPALQKFAENVTGDVANLPWADLVTTDALPTPNAPEHTADVGAFEGAAYCTTNRYRPQAHCLMKELSAELCKVCSRELDRTFAAWP